MTKWGQVCVLGIALLTLTTTLSCSGPHRHIDVYPPPTNLPHADHVIIVIIDGLRPDAITETGMPTLYGIIPDSAYSLMAQTTFPSITLPSHASLITGLPPDDHDIFWNSWKPNRGYLRIASIFTLAREAGLTTALFGGKKKLLHLAEPGVINHVRVRKQPDSTVMKQALAFIEGSRPHFTLIQLPNVDVSGHRYGWLSSEQRQTIRDTDRLIGKLLEKVEAFQQAGERWNMIITSDHGGHERTHGTDDPVDMTIPWILWGNASETGMIRRVSITSSATTTARILGLSVPQAWLEYEQASTIQPQTPYSQPSK